MTPLGDHFPVEIKRTSAVRNTAPGMVIKLQAVMNDEKMHEKRFLIVHVDEFTVACVINTRINRFIINNPDPRLLQCQVRIECKTHPFMDWDSHIDCSKVWKYKTSEVVESVIQNPEWVFGEITEALRDEVVAAIKYAPQIAPIEVGIYCASLNSANL